MAEKLGPAKSFGARYGTKVKHRYAKIHKERTASKKCPFCKKLGIKRLAAGIWFCKKCRTKFAGKAYTPV